ncbi:MAG: hypothetical protein IPJ59_30225 [Nannocystis sp.]|nr:hypothetical protein [Nannocystis sp.]MBK7829440.1 hypothetical protein [Nannocystis sp.]
MRKLHGLAAVSLAISAASSAWSCTRWRFARVSLAIRGGVLGTQPLERGVSASQSDDLGSIVRVPLLELDVLLMQPESPGKHVVHLGLRVTFASCRRRAFGLGSGEKSLQLPHGPRRRRIGHSMKMPHRFLRNGLHFHASDDDRLGHGLVNVADEDKVLLGTQRDDEPIERRQRRVRGGIVEHPTELRSVHVGDLGERGHGRDVLADHDLLQARDDRSGVVVEYAVEARSRLMDELEVDAQRRVRLWVLKQREHLGRAVVGALHQLVLAQVRAPQP